MDEKVKQKLRQTTGVNLPTALSGCQIVYIFLSGSRAYGINDENSDYDLVAVFVAPPVYYLGLNVDKLPDAIEVKEIETDIGLVGIKYYEMRHFIRLALQNNPNVLEGLWTDEDLIIYSCNTMLKLKLINQLFLSTEKSFHSYRGYAFDQLGKMMGPNTPTGRMGAKRKEYLDKYGYDIKNATHVVRLLYTVIDLIENQRIRVRLDDESVGRMKAVRAGRYTLDEFNNLVVGLTNRVDRCMDQAKLESRILKSEPRAIEATLVAAFKEHFRWDQ